MGKNELHVGGQRVRTKIFCFSELMKLKRCEIQITIVLSSHSYFHFDGSP